MLKREILNLIKATGAKAKCNHNTSKDALIQRAQELGLLDKDYKPERTCTQHPRQVIATNIQTGEIQEFKFICAGAKHFKITAMGLRDRDGKLLQNTYKIHLC